MDIVVTHASADFDALAAAMAACKLYPGAVAVMTRGMARGVRDFATLHRDRFPWLTPKDFDQDAVRRLVIVDVRRAERLREIPVLLARIERRDPTLEVHVWDHHPAAPDDVRADRVFVEPVGSATTLLVEAIRARGLPVDPVEATLFALGVHTDTGSLSYPTTSPRDAEALAWLLGRGASSRVVRRFLTTPFSSPQRLALAMAIERVQERRICGLRIAIAAIEPSTPVEGLDAVASELFHIERPHALFLIATAPSGRVSVVARSRDGTLDVAAILAGMGGGGHPSAAALS
ncbi:MAG: DHHA1 domain-containing protein, partial [Myxococcota bacterium]|nr:DHHA1 domain-containing protein [Myxococcota bacterium]